MGDFETWLPKAYSDTVFSNVDSIPQRWKDYITGTPNISSSYANMFVGTLPGERYEFYTNSNFNKIK